MVDAVVIGGVEQEAPPARRIETAVDVLVHANGQTDSARDQEGARQEVEEAAYAQANQEQLDRVSDCSLIDIELRYVVMRCVEDPERLPVVHASVHPVLPEVEDERDRQCLYEQGQADKPFKALPVERALDEFHDHILAQIHFHHGDDGHPHADVENVGRKLFPRNIPAIVAWIDPFEDHQEQTEADKDHEPGRGDRDLVGRIIPESDCSKEHHGLEIGKEGLLEGAAFHPPDILPADSYRRIGSDNSVANLGPVHRPPPRALDTSPPLIGGKPTNVRS